MRKNVSGQHVAFQMISATDGSNVTAGTPTVYVTKDGGTQATGSGTSTHEGNGQWSYAPTQSETDANHVVFTMAISGAISQAVNIYPVAFNPADAVRLGLTALPNAAADAAGGLPISDAGGLDLDARLDVAVSTRASQTSVNTIDSIVDDILIDTTAILLDTAEIGAAGAGLTEAGGTGDQFTAIPWNSNWDVEVQSECADALVAINLDHLMAVAVTGGDVVDNSALARIVSKSATADWDTYNQATESLEALRDNMPANFNILLIQGGIGYVTAASVVGDVDGDVKGNVEGNVTGSVGSVLSLGTTAQNQVNAQADAAIETYHLQYIFASAYDPSSKPGNASGLFNILVENDSGIPRYTANSLELAPSGGGGGDATEANQDIIIGYLEDIMGTTFDTSTDSLEAIRNRGDVAWTTATGFSTLTQADIRAAVGLASASLDTQLDGIDTAIAGLNDLSQADIRAAVGLASASLDTQLDGIALGIGGLNDLGIADVQTALTSQGYTSARAVLLDNLTSILSGVEKNRKVLSNRVLVNSGETLVTVYEDDGTTPAFSFTISGDKRERTPV